MPSTLEIRVESIKYAGNLQLEFLQCFFDRASVTKRYVACDLEIHCDIITTCCNRRYLIFIAEPEGTSVSHNVESPVFVGVREVSELGGPVATRARLQTLDCRLVFRDKELQPPFFISPPRRSIFDYELGDVFYNLICESRIES